MKDGFEQQGFFNKLFHFYPLKQSRKQKSSTIWQKNHILRRTSAMPSSGSDQSVKHEIKS